MADPKKILIIDDDPDIVEAARIVLQSRQYRVFTAASGEEGLRTAAECKPDLIILDVMMETIDKGFEVSRALRKDPVLKFVPILMLTAIKEVTDINFNAGNTYTDELPADYFERPAAITGSPDAVPVDAFYEKPIKAEDLLGKVKSLLKE
jgi:CheY-like chemotaxis protein